MFPLLNSSWAGSSQKGCPICPIAYQEAGDDVYWPSTGDVNFGYLFQVTIYTVSHRKVTIFHFVIICGEIL